MTKLDDLLPSAKDACRRSPRPRPRKPPPICAIRRMARRKRSAAGQADQAVRHFDDERMEAGGDHHPARVSNGLTEVFLGKMPKELFRITVARSIRPSGLGKYAHRMPKEAYDFWRKYLQPRGI